MQRRAYDQAVSLGTIQQIALEREHELSLGLISDLDYKVEMVHIDEELPAKGADAV